MQADNSWFDKSNLRVFIVFIVCFGFIYLDSINQKIFNKTKSIINDAVAYASYGVTYPFKKIVALPNFIKETIKLTDQHQQIKALENQIEELTQQNKFLKKDFKKFETFLSEENSVKFETIKAKVLIEAKNFISDSFIINKGSESGLKIGNPVIKNNYLIGQITEVNQKTSRGIFLTDVNSRIPVLVGENLYQSILIGSPLVTSKLSLEFLPKNSELKNGDIIYTSEIEGVLKKGILVGTIIKSNENEKNMKNDYSIKQNYEKLEVDYVSVLVK